MLGWRRNSRPPGDLALLQQSPKWAWQHWGRMGLRSEFRAGGLIGSGCRFEQPQSKLTRRKVSSLCDPAIPETRRAKVDAFLNFCIEFCCPHSGLPTTIIKEEEEPTQQSESPAKAESSQVLVNASDPFEPKGQRCGQRSIGQRSRTQ